MGLMVAAFTHVALMEAQAAEARARGRSPVSPQAVGRASAPIPVTAPLPPPRPPDLPAPLAAQAGSAPAAPAAPAVDPAALAACLRDFAARGGEAMPPRSAEGSADMGGACAIPGPVTFARVRLPDGAAVTLDSAVTVRCTLAVELAGWIRDDLAAIAARQGASLAQIIGVGGHACRPRNGQAGAPISEHASGNAFDLRAIKLADGRVIALAQADPGTKAFREAVRTSACARFATVLGPGADSSHADHLHVDMRQRRGGFRLCQWSVD